MVRKYWSEDEDAILEELYYKGLTNQDIADKLGRSINSIQHRISKKNLYDKYIKGDLTGKTFDRLTVLGLDHIDANGKKYWLCVCNCSDKNTIVVPTDRLNSGKTKSCGCIRKETLSATRKGYNNYYIVGDVTYVQYRNSYDCFIVDTEDLHKIKDFCWYNHNGYPYTHLKNDEQIGIHRLLMGLSNDNPLQVDHRRGKGSEWNNCKENLRICTNQQNSFNKGLKSTNISGYVGVKHNEQRDMWDAHITVYYKYIFLGTYETKEEAYAVRLKAERELWDYEFIPDERKMIDIDKLMGE